MPLYVCATNIIKLINLACLFLQVFNDQRRTHTTTNT
ncbi:MAG: hypothetical protein ACI9LG_000740, partial [Moritella dasanensis]